jgi:UDP-glucuronate 4-epimerase
VTVLVTGCAGFIGSQLAQSLLDDGTDVRGVDCFTDNYDRALKERNLDDLIDHDRFAFSRLDLADADLAPILDGADVVYHLAAEPGVRASWGARFDSYLTNNVLATQRLLEVVRTMSDTRVVYASSSSVYGNAERMPTDETVTPKPFSPYGTTKLAGEHLCGLYAANYGVHVVSLRYFSVYGPRQRPDMGFRIFSEAVLKGAPIEIFGDGRQTRDFTYVGDVITATRAAAERPIEPGLVINVGGGSRVSLRHAVEVLEEVAGRSLDVIYTSEQRGDVRDTGADTTLAQRELGFTPGASLKEGLAAEFEWVRSLTAGQSR